MKKIILLSIMFLASLSSYSQLATLNQQTITVVRIDTTNARLASLRSAGYNNATAANQATQTTSLGVINTSLGTITTSLGVISSTLGIQTASIAVLKQKADTTNQSLRLVNTNLAATNATIGINTASLAVIKTKQDTIAQNTRAINSAVSGTLSSYSYDKISHVVSAIATSTDAYSSGDNIGGITTLTNVTRGAALSSELISISIWDNENQKPNIVIDFYGTSPSGTYTDNEAQVMAGDAGVWLGSISVTSAQFVTQGAIARYTISYNLVHEIFSGSASTSYYMTISTTSTPTWASANGLVVKTSYKQD